MEYYHIVLFLLAIAIAVSSLAPHIKVPYPVLLMLAGIALGFIPDIEYVPVSPDVVFLIFLPPLLYDAALKTDFPNFKANVRTISMLAVTMVFVTMCAIAVAAHYIIPDLSWPVAFVIGAILSPPDAVAATSIINNMRLPTKTKVILEGESLVNDASALTAYRIAMGVVAGGAFVFWEAGLEFIYIIAGGTAIGIGIAMIFIWILKKVPFTSTATVSLNILLPFAAYQIAESLGVSGVLSVVSMGLIIARKVQKNKLFSDMTVEQSRSFWSVLIYLLNCIVFIMIGLEFPTALEDIPKTTVIPLIISSVVIFLIALLVRILLVFEYKFRRDKFKFTLRHHGNDIKQVRQLDWKNALIIGWSGMRGIVSVATAIAIPVVMANGEAFPHRNSIIFLTVVVVVLMLVVQGMGLPLLIRLLKVDQPDIIAKTNYPRPGRKPVNY